MFQTNLDASMGRHERQAQEPMRGLLLDDDLLDEEMDTDNYDDTRAELRSTGHNVTSVLMNPRETLLEDLMDEFASEQSTVLDTLHPILPVTAEVEECRRIVVKLRALMGRRARALGATMVTRAPTNQDVETCFREVPSIFFRPVSAQTALLKAEDLRDILEHCGADSPAPPSTSPRRRKRAGSRAGLDNTRDHNNNSKGSKEKDGGLHRRGSKSFNTTTGSSEGTSGEAEGDREDSKDNSKDRAGDGHTNGQSRSQSNGESEGAVGTSPARAQQDRLSQYLDLVEVALLKQIWSRSPAFFRASDDIRALQEQVKTAGHMISARRRDLQNIAAGLQSGPMRIPHLHTRAQNQRKLLHKLSSIQRILKGRAAVETLMSVEDHLGALQVTSDTLACYRKECADVVALKVVGEQLQQYEDAIGQVMCDKFASMALAGEEISTGDGADYDVEAEGAQALAALLRALLEVNKTEPALQLYNARLLECVKIVVRSCVSEYLVHLDTDLSHSIQSGSTTAAQSALAAMDDSPFSVRVKEMSNESFFACMQMCFEQLLGVLQTADVVNRFIVETLADSLSSPGDGGTPEGSPHSERARRVSIAAQGEEAAAGELRVADITRAIEISVTCIKSACDASQRYISQFLVLRKESCSNLGSEQMKQLWSSVSSFVIALERLNSTGGKVGAEAVSGAGGTPHAQPHSSSAYTLRKTVVGIVKSFIDRVHDANKSKLVSTLDSERWVQCDVSAERQAKIERLATGRAFLNDRKEVAAAVSAVSSARSVNIDGQTYITAWSALLLIEMLMEYIGFAAVFSSKVTEDSVIPKMAELLHLFDTHTHRLVLGAQATKAAAALKSISARHLAVTVQSIGVVLLLLPHARTALMGHLSAAGGSSSFLVEIDRISNQYSEHQSKLLTKFVTIVGEAVDISGEKRLGNTDWDRFNGQCEYFEEIVRNVTALHRVLSATLPPEQVQNVFTRIFMHLNRKIPLHFDDIMPNTQTGKQRILDEVSHLVVSFQQLPQVSAAAVTLEDTFRKKYNLGKK